MKWLLDTIAANTQLDLDHAEGREKMAAAVLKALPRYVVASAIRESTGAVLHERGIRDTAGDLARELGNNAAQSVLLMLHVGEDTDGDMKRVAEVSSCR